MKRIATILLIAVLTGCAHGTYGHFGLASCAVPAVEHQ